MATSSNVTEATGDLDGLVAHVAETLEAAGAAFQRGDMVICRVDRAPRWTSSRARSGLRSSSNRSARFIVYAFE